MYGTVARMRVKPGKIVDFERMGREGATRIPGMVFQHVYRMDTNPDEYLLVVGFERKEAYQANAASPEQHARYEEYVQLLEAEPEWNDGEIVYSVP